MSEILTENAVKLLKKGVQMVKPKVKIIAIKSIVSASGEPHFRLMLSDGDETYNDVMLSTKLNQFILQQQIVINCIVQLEKVIFNVRENRRVAIVTDLSVISSGEPPTKASSTTRKLALPIIPISSLDPHLGKVQLCGRVSHLSSIKQFSNARGDGQLFTCVIFDDSGQVQITGFNSAVDKFYSTLTVNSVVKLTGFDLKPSNKRFNFTNHQFEVYLSNTTTIEQVESPINVPELQYQFAPLNSIGDRTVGDIIDVLGIIRRQSDVINFNLPHSGQEQMKRDIFLIDQGNVEVKMTLWGDAAYQFERQDGSVIAIHKVKIASFKNLYLNASFITCIVDAPDISQTRHLQTWYSKFGSTLVPSSITASVSIKLVELDQVLLDKHLRIPPAGYEFRCILSILDVETTNAMYKACPSCHKKLDIHRECMLWCAKCNKPVVAFEWRFLLRVLVCRLDTRLWMTAFHQQAEQIIGVRASELGVDYENDPIEFKKRLKPALYKIWSLHICMKFENFSGIPRLQHLIRNVGLPNHAEYSRFLILDILKK